MVAIGESLGLYRACKAEAPVRSRKIAAPDSNSRLGAGISLDQKQDYSCRHERERPDKVNIEPGTLQNREAQFLVEEERDQTGNEKMT
jgi:hypothetical protein